MRLVVLFILFLVILTGCSYNTTDSSQAKTDNPNQNTIDTNTNIEIPYTKEIDINGINEIQEINSTKDIILKVNGLDHKITVLRGTNVTSVDVNGQNIVINLPKETQPIIRKNGINVSIKYY
jgi:hypothetical protein